MDIIVRTIKRVANKLAKSLDIYFKIAANIVLFIPVVFYVFIKRKLDSRPIKSESDMK